DNADAFYQYAPIDPRRTYKVRGKKGDSVYLSLTVYGGPDDGRYSERIVGAINHRQLDIASHRTLPPLLRPPPHHRASLKLPPPPPTAGLGCSAAPPPACPTPRHYPAARGHPPRVEWHTEAVAQPSISRLDAAAPARRFRAVLTWLRDQANIVPLALGEPNTV